MDYEGRWETVTVGVDGGLAWVTLNRPDKRNAKSPTLNREMFDGLEALDADEEVGVLVLTGAGESFSAGMDLKEYFREVDGAPEHVQRKVRWDNGTWQFRRLRNFAKPTIAMVNGWGFGGAAAARRAAPVGSRDALLYIMTGRTFDGPRAASMGLVNESVPCERLREVTEELARELLGKNPIVLRAAKLGFRNCREMSWDVAEDYLYAKLEQSQFLDPEHGREQGMKQFLDEKKIRPGLQGYER